MNNLEDSEDPAQDSYASPDRQLPYQQNNEPAGNGYEQQESYNAMGGGYDIPPE